MESEIILLAAFLTFSEPWSDRRAAAIVLWKQVESQERIASSHLERSDGKGACQVISANVSSLVASFGGADAKGGADQSAHKSRELVLQLLEHTPEPFSRSQFAPGHITCTGVVLHPDRDAFLLVHHRRLNRWLLPGGHVEKEDRDIWDTARREVIEETGAILKPCASPMLAGIDVHGIPPKRGEPYHLHHDLIFAFQAASPVAAPTEEVRSVAWCGTAEGDRYDLPLSIRLSVLRALAAGV